MPNVMAAQSNIGGALCESSAIPFLVPRRKVWMTPAAGVPCSNAANIGERKTWTYSEFCTQKSIYTVCQNHQNPKLSGAKFGQDAVYLHKNFRAKA